MTDSYVVKSGYLMSVILCQLCDLCMNSNMFHVQQPNLEAVSFPLWSTLPSLSDIGLMWFELEQGMFSNSCTLLQSALISEKNYVGLFCRHFLISGVGTMNESSPFILVHCIFLCDLHFLQFSPKKVHPSVLLLVTLSVFLHQVFSCPS